MPVASSAQPSPMCLTDRLAAAINGLRELDRLREHHILMMQRLKLRFGGLEKSSNMIHNDECTNDGDTESLVAEMARCRREMQQEMQRLRSSLRGANRDSGCFSLSSEPSDTSTTSTGASPTPIVCPVDSGTSAETATVTEAQLYGDANFQRCDVTFRKAQTLHSASTSSHCPRSLHDFFGYSNTLSFVPEETGLLGAHDSYTHLCAGNNVMDSQQHHWEREESRYPMRAISSSTSSGLLSLSRPTAPQSATMYKANRVYVVEPIVERSATIIAANRPLLSNIHRPSLKTATGTTSTQDTGCGEDLLVRHSKVSPPPVIRNFKLTPRLISRSASMNVSNCVATAADTKMLPTLKRDIVIHPPVIITRSLSRADSLKAKKTRCKTWHESDPL